MFQAALGRGSPGNQGWSPDNSYWGSEALDETADKELNRATNPQVNLETDPFSVEP